LRARQFVLRSPTRNPGLDLIQWYGESSTSKIVVAAAVFSDIGTREIYHRIEQGNGFGEYGRNVLPALLCHLAKTGVGIGIDLKRAIDKVHDRNLASIDGLSRPL
jgi:hypothetical protein